MINITNPVPQYTIGMDVGGTKIATGLVTRDGEIIYEDRRPTVQDPAQIIHDMAASICEVWSNTGQSHTPIGVGVPGLVTNDGVLRYGPNIAITEMDIRAQLQDKFPFSTIHVDNDANVALWAEYCLGVARLHHAKDIVMFTLGTGIGGAIMVNGKLARGANGFAGELGHIIIERDGLAGPSGIPGEIEAYSSGTAIGRIAREYDAQRKLQGSLLGEVSGELSGKHVTQAALQGDDVAHEILREVGQALGIASAGLVNALDPDLVVVGGGAARASHIILEHMQLVQDRYTLGVPAYRKPVLVEHAHFSENAGIVGAALLAFRSCGA